MKNNINKARLFIFPCEQNNYRPTVLDGRFLSYVALVLVLLKFVSLFHFIFLPRTPYFADVSRRALVQMANEERIAAGLIPLIENQKLIKAAELKAQDMLQRDYFSHWSPDGVSPWHWFNVVGYEYRYAGENLAIGFFNAKDIHRSWIASPSHRNNILGPNYNDIGIAVVEGDFYGHTTFLVVQVFGMRDVAPLVTIPEIAQEPITTETILPENEPEIVEVPSVEEEPLINDALIADEKLDPDISSVLGVGPVISPAGPEELGGIRYSLFNFLMVEYDDMVRQLIFYIMLFLGFVMVVNVFVKFNVQHPDLIFKGFAFLLLFLALDYFDQMTLMRMMTDILWIG